MTGWIIFGSILLVLIFLFTRPVKVTAIYDAHPELRVKFLFFTIVKVPADPEKQKKKAAKLAKKEEKKRIKEAKKAWKEERKHPHGNSALLSMAEEENADARTEQEESSGSGAKAENVKDAKTVGPEKKEKPAKTPKKKKPKRNYSLIDMILDYVRSASPPIKRLFRKIRIRDVYIDYVVGSDDAAKTALKYGGLCAAIYSIIGNLQTFMDTKVKEINIEADFSAEKDDIFAYAVVKLRVSTAIGCGLWLGVRLLKTYLKYNKDTSPKHKGRPDTKARPAKGMA
ncbi:MAG: DUF2953 domain-containing protein [Ruminiclostridium sp.]|nr:DUF2953 domain-containing protein [Ruminiclostridium sp.]